VASGVGDIIKPDRQKITKEKKDEGKGEERGNLKKTLKWGNTIPGNSNPASS